MENLLAIKILNSATPIAFLVLLIFFIVISIILNYHWTRYGIEEKNIQTVRMWYFGFSLILFFGMAISLLIILL